MLPTLVRRSATARKPLIHFIGKRQWPAHTDAPHPHPYAPAEIKQAFGEFTSKSASSAAPSQSAPSSSKSGSGVQAYEEFWYAPERLWRHTIDEVEIDAILSGGATAAKS
ncbi:hypothetical protein EUX98_g2028 [Antrodiella citrinella]|uniref:Uncharacterized protein n=1 Tax=Antrodiella citrinella TaxID=2447956 RepID=A0A4S4N2B1_9APHY|nr:hypothetical protein EUX98_g2028 [Antrodiella citrinella]